MREDTVADPTVCPECGADADMENYGWDKRLTEEGCVPAHVSPNFIADDHDCTQLVKYRCTAGHDVYYRGHALDGGVRVDEPDEWTWWGCHIRNVTWVVSREGDPEGGGPDDREVGP